MNIKGLENACKRVLKYAQDLDDHDGKLYRKSINSVKDCCDILENTLDLLYDILSDSSDCKMVETSTVIDEKLSDRVDNLVNLKDDNVEIDKKFVMNAYDNALSALPSQVESYEEPQECAELIYQWFSLRFDPSNSLSTGYRVDRIGEWIENIIMCYGYHVEYGSREQFVQDFTNWCNNIPKGERYILPKYIYRYSKSLNRQDVTRCAMMIHKIFMIKGGLNQLSALPPPYDMKKGNVFTRFSKCFENVTDLSDTPLVYHSDSFEDRCKESHITIIGEI